MRTSLWATESPPTEKSMLSFLRRCATLPLFRKLPSMSRATRERLSRAIGLTPMITWFGSKRAAIGGGTEAFGFGTDRAIRLIIIHTLPRRHHLHLRRR